MPAAERDGHRRPSALATLGCVYVVFYSFGQRRALGESTRADVRRRATRAFGLGVLSLAGYLADFYVVPNAIQEGGLLPPVDPVLLAYDASLAAFYVGLFVLITRAFVLLGLMEYLDVD